MHLRRYVAAAGGLALLLAACGSDGDPEEKADADADRTVEIEMSDNAFSPTDLAVAQGETVRFVFSNAGEVAHDAFVGDTAAQEAHEDEMQEAEEMGHGADSDGAVTVEPGDEAELVYTFTESGAVEVGCHQPGHYASGMKLDVAVT